MPPDLKLEGDVQLSFKESTPGVVQCMLLNEDLDAIEQAHLAGNRLATVTVEMTLDQMVAFLLDGYLSGSEAYFDDQTEAELLPVAAALEAAAGRLRLALKKRR